MEVCGDLIQKIEAKKPRHVIMKSMIYTCFTYSFRTHKFMHFLTYKKTL